MTYFNFKLRTLFRMIKYLFAVALMLLVGHSLCAQSTMKEKVFKERKEFSDRTLFQRFEGKMAPTADERRKKMEQNRAKRRLLLSIIDTAQIKLELKKKLSRDVVHDPFSKRLKKFMYKYKLKDKIALAH